MCRREVGEVGGIQWWEYRLRRSLSLSHVFVEKRREVSFEHPFLIQLLLIFIFPYTTVRLGSNSWNHLNDKCTELPLFFPIITNGSQM